MSENIKIGRFGEDRACEYLVQRGWRILTRNYRRKSDEIDIIARSREGMLVFFEVKTLLIKRLSPVDALVPEDNLTSAKLRKISRTCQFVVRKHPELVNEDLGWRIDLLAIDLENDGETYKIKEIRHYENIG